MRTGSGEFGMRPSSSNVWVSTSGIDPAQARREAAVRSPAVSAADGERMRLGTRAAVRVSASLDRDRRDQVLVALLAQVLPQLPALGEADRLVEHVLVERLEEQQLAEPEPR